MKKNAIIIKKELIGCFAEVVKSKNKDLLGLRGKIIDETKNLFVVETKKGEKKVPKDQATFVIEFPDGEKFEIDGSLLVGRPERRIKAKFPKKRV